MPTKWGMFRAIAYLRTKKERMGHTLNLESQSGQGQPRPQMLCPAISYRDEAVPAPIAQEDAFEFATIEEALTELKAGRIVVVIDDEDLAGLAGMYPAGVICEIVNDDGTMARVPDLIRFCRKHGLLMITVADLARYRLELDFETSIAAIEGLLPISPKFPPLTARRFEPADLCLTGNKKRPAKAGTPY